MAPIDRKSKRQKLSPAEDLSPSTSQALSSSASDVGTTQIQESIKTPSPPNTRSPWHNGTWPRKAAPVTQVARESISSASNIALEAAANIKDKVRATPSRKPSLAFLGKTTSNKSLPADAATTKDHATPQSRKTSKDPVLPPAEPEDVRSKPISEVDTPSENTAQKIGRVDQKPDEQKPQAESEVPKQADTAPETIGPRSWIGWLARGDATTPAIQSSMASSQQEGESQQTEQSKGAQVDHVPEPAPETIPLPPDDAEESAKQPSSLQRRSWLPIWSNAAATQSAPAINLPPDDKHTEQELQVSLEPGKPKLDEASVQRASEEIPSTSDALPKQPEESGKSSAWIFWSRGKAADTKSLDETPLKGEIAIANTETESQPRRASLGLKKDAKPVSITTNASEAASSSADDKKITRTSGEIDSSKTIDPNSTPKTTKIESKGAAATAIAPVKQQELRPASPAPSKKAYEHLLLPPFEGTLKLPENLTWMEQLTRLIYGTKEPDFKHLNLVKDPPRIRNALAIGVHGYFPAPLIRSVLGQPTGTSVKFADMAAKSIQRWTRDRGYECQVKSAALEGEGKISERIDLLWKLLLNWIDEIRKSDFVMIACHSQGVPVATMLVAKLIHFGCIASSTRVGICAMAGVNMGPFPEFKSRWISGSAAELFEFSDADSKVSTDYRNALEDVLKFGVRITYVGSIDDQLVSLESSVFAPISHPHIYRAVSIDSRMHAPSFLSHLVAFALKLRNLGVQDHGLIRELSGPLAGSLYSGDGHSRLYEDPGIYNLAVSFTLETTSMPGVSVTQRVASSSTGNPFILPFAMRGMLEEDYVKSDLQEEAEELLKEFDEWKPTTKALKDVKWRLEGIRSRL